MNADNQDSIDSTATNESQNLYIDIDGHRPVDRSDLEVRDIIDIDGSRPVVASDLEVSDILEIDGQRPIAKSNFQEHGTLDIDGSRPVDPSVLEIQGTLDIDGSRPIASNNTENPEIPDDYIDQNREHGIAFKNKHSKR